MKMKFIKYLIGLYLFCFLGGGIFPLLGKDLLFLKPLRRKWERKLPAGEVKIPKPKVAFLFQEVSPKSPLGQKAKKIENHKSIKEFLQYFLQIHKALKTFSRPWQPIPIVFSGHNGVSFCIFQPYLILESSNPFRMGPVIYLSKQTILTLQTGALPIRTLVHEMGHAFMGQFFQISQAKLPVSAEYGIALIAGEGHWRNKKTDPVFAWIEGWAEYCDLHYNASPKYGFPYLKRNLSTITITEGAIADLLYYLDIHSGIPKFHSQALFVIAKKQPIHIHGFFKAYFQIFPEEKKIILETISRAAQNKWFWQENYHFPHLLKDSKDNWKRFQRLLEGRIKAFMEDFFQTENWKLFGRELFKS
ncbi:MAG: hypothetical protein D6785_16705, partial [Planctomycetota bacterium]